MRMEESEAALQVQSVKKVLFTTVRKISTTFSFVFDLTTAKKKVSMATDVAFFDILVED